ncbi:hypothetical protein C8F01DRAFT_1254839 [Mycena amicta]|nr:hypothetical protein C8F01DRAFT_1254839 [Mycena amicta]
MPPTTTVNQAFTSRSASTPAAEAPSFTPGESVSVSRQKNCGSPAVPQIHAVAACQPTATCESIQRIARWFDWKNPRLDRSEGVVLLPICYVHLDPAAIPSRKQIEALEDWNESNNKVTGTIACAIAALQLFIVVRGVPQDTEPWLWPRTWAWFHFIDTYFDLLFRSGLWVALAEEGERPAPAPPSRAFNASTFVCATHCFSHREFKTSLPVLNTD